MPLKYLNNYINFIELFNRAEFFKSHEVLEELWKVASSELKPFYQGLIQAAVALHHIRRNNIEGAKYEYIRSRQKLEKYPHKYCGIDLKNFLEQMDQFINYAQSTGQPKLPTINFKP